MNILLIGNGFDLAHGLPTKYGDFLEFCRSEIRKEYAVRNARKFSLNHFDEKEFEVADLVKNNIWIDYFLEFNMHKKDKWIDFESKISNVIQEIDNDIHGGSDIYKLDDEVKRMSNDFLNKQFYGLQRTYRELRDRLLVDLYRLIRALELYLCQFVENINIKGMLPDIQEICFDKILSFNYTDTYRKIYDPKELCEYDYIHGKVNMEHSLETNNMVLGIDEYLSKKRKNRDVEFIAFKKYYQRIYKETGCKYKEWVDDIRSDKSIKNLRFTNIDASGSKIYKSESSKFHKLYVFGHSLDITDKDILRELILNENVYTTIFYYNRDDFGAKIANLVKVIGQDELIRRTGGSAKTIEFKLQQDMVERSKK